MLFVMWLVGTGIATVSIPFLSLQVHILMQKRTDHVGQPWLVPGVFAMPSP